MRAYVRACASARVRVRRHTLCVFSWVESSIPCVPTWAGIPSGGRAPP